MRRGSKSENLNGDNGLSRGGWRGGGGGGGGGGGIPWLTFRPVWGILADTGAVLVARATQELSTMPQSRPLRTAKFTDAEVLAIRGRAARFERTPREEAAIYNCSPETVRKLIRGETYTHVVEGRGEGIPLRRERDKEIERKARESQQRLAAQIGPHNPLEGGEPPDFEGMDGAEHFARQAASIAPHADKMIEEWLGQGFRPREEDSGKGDGKGDGKS